MQRYLDARAAADLKKKLVFLTGPRQVGKTTLSRLLMRGLDAQYLNYDVALDRAVIERQSWRPTSQLLVLDEIHKMPGWKTWLKGVIDGGVVDGKAASQQLLVTGSARMDTFRQSGDSLAGRYYALRLHPLSVREWCAHAPPEIAGLQAPTPEQALSRLLERGGFPEPMLEADPVQADRWRRQYIDGLLREDVLEFSRIQELTGMRLFVDMLRQRVGSPLSLASMGRDLNVSSPTLRRYLDILQALYIVFSVQPWHRNVARSVLQQPKVYFYDSGLVNVSGGDEGARFENLVACHLLKHAQWQQDALGRECNLHYLRTKDGAGVDFALSDGDTLTDLIECKWADAQPHRALARFAGEWQQARAVQVVRQLRQAEQRGAIEVCHAGEWLARLSV